MVFPRGQRDNLSAADEVAFECCKHIHDRGETLVEHLLVTREERNLIPMLHRYAAIAVKLDLMDPLVAYGSAVPGLHCIDSMKASCRAPPNCLVLCCIGLR